MKITARNNQKIKDTAELLKSSKARRQAGLYVVEGPRMVSEVPTCDIAEVFVSESFAKNNPFPDNIVKWCTAAKCGESFNEITDVTDEVYEKLSDTKTPQGIMALVRMKQPQPEALFTGGPILILENIQDPGNLGTMFRTGEAAGVGGIIMDENTVDVYNPKVIRSTMGAIFRVPFVKMRLAEAADLLKKEGYELFAAHLKGEKSFTDISYGRAAFMIGNEGNGLTEGAAALADSYLRIPMEGQVESLNAAVAASLLVYEWHRQNK